LDHLSVNGFIIADTAVFCSLVSRALFEKDNYYDITVDEEAYGDHIF